MVAANRASAKGIKFKIDYDKLLEFSKNFKFSETEDQLATLEEVYHDLNSDKLMDRLVCGDVGFGKTEIALRATAIVTDNDYNVLIIAPTTLLARQHFTTFKKRFDEIENVAMIDRNTIPSKKENNSKRIY